MNKGELISSMSTKTGATKKDMEAALIAFQETVIEELKSGGKIQLVGFLTFEVTETKKDRICGNPKDPSAPKTVIPAGTKKPKVKIGSKVKEAVK